MLKVLIYNYDADIFRLILRHLEKKNNPGSEFSSMEDGHGITILNETSLNEFNKLLGLTLLTSNFIILEIIILEKTCKFYSQRRTEI